MAGKIIAQIVLVGTQVVGRAFMEAYRQAVANPAAKNAAARAAGGNGSKAVNELTRKTGMSVEEAAQILNVETSTSLEQLQKNYDHLFKVNEKSAGGSFYLQSKVFRAKERFDMEHKWKKDQEQDSDTSPTDEPQKKK